MDKILQEAAITPELATIFLFTIFLLIVAIGIVVLVLVYQKKQLQYLGDKEQLRVKFDKEILESKLEIQEQTFKNISKEIHDNIGQILSLAKITINTMDCDDKQMLGEKINTASELVSQAIQDLRDLSRSLNADAIAEMGLLKSIEYELELIKKSGRYQTNLIKEGAHQRLSHKHELILFRIFQETLNNVLKHSKASEINMKINYNSTNFIMHISDNGIGFDPSSMLNKDNTVKSASGGITNITNRAGLIGADFRIISEEGKGTTVTIDLPLNE
ncbi:MAG: ATP-binding protein [Bacteroidota bacterium]|nr:ATP-binding protein [Bacteroidota bacterium]MDQ6889215.1 ATP-binding protein [Bacteroidota bacterium]